MESKVNLLGRSQKNLEDFFVDINEPSFRGKQLLKWVHQKGELDFDNMSNFNKKLREKLKEIAVLIPPKVEKVLVSEGGTKKYLIQLIVIILTSMNKSMIKMNFKFCYCS